MEQYHSFVASKSATYTSTAFEYKGQHTYLKPFQSDIVRWACARGRGAIFADTGLGKTAMQLAWADAVQCHTQGIVLIVAPFGVTAQTVEEGVKFGVAVTYVRSMPTEPGIYITNYEMLHTIDMEGLAGLALDESSILKSQTGRTRTELIESAQAIPFRLACTATPSPNDYMEIGNHAEFLGIMRQTEMLAMFFTHDGGDTSKWRLKGHAKTRFWEWLATWCIMIKKPHDLGYEDKGYDLPPLSVSAHFVSSPIMPGEMFSGMATDIHSRRLARRESIENRIEKLVGLLGLHSEKALIWCDLNDEQKAIEKALGKDAVSIKGDTPLEKRMVLENEWRTGNARFLVTKGSIFGFGMNWQHCHHVLFFGLSDSWETYYQSIRRCYRFGQTQPVSVDIIMSDSEQSVMDNIRRKDTQFLTMGESMVGHMRVLMQKNIGKATQDKTLYRPTVTMILPEFIK